MTDNFEFRSIHPDEVEQAIAIEQICFPPNEACSPKAMTERIAKDRKSTRLNSSHDRQSRMPSSA